ncbi:type II secretion system secretin GspD [Thalassomonas sp. M1454]|uniref:type II secretion system secretin GspD n=1 Tax=Thalassomonas sp. M1454 TaxID=2594477 RepID=UPI00163D9538|nr:type II secretion system secretin GspD [Thalassomonas sp. M1454]
MFNIQIALLLCLLFSFPSKSQENPFSPNFNGTDIDQFINVVGKNLQKTMVIDPKVRGKVYVRSYSKLDNEQYYQFFQNVLSIYGYTAIEEDNGVVKVILKKDAKKQNLPIVTQQNSINGDTLVHKVIHVNNITVRDLSPMLRQLSDQSGGGNVSSYNQANLLLITGSASAVEKLSNLVESMDKYGISYTEIVPIIHSSAIELATIINEMQSNSKKAEYTSSRIVADQRSNSVIIQGDKLTINKLKALINKLDKKLELNSNTRIYYLNYANAEEVANLILKLHSDTLEGGAQAHTTKLKVDFHQDTNSIVVKSDPALFSTIETIIRKLDIRRAQVLVEAIIVEILESDGVNLGVQWYSENTGMVQFNNGQAPIGGLVNAAKNADDSDEVSTQNNDDVSDLLSTVTGGLVAVGDDDFGALIQAVSTNTNSNILATPSIITLDNEEASFLVGQEVPIITGSTAGDNNSNPFQTIERVDVGTKLTVTPQINSGNAVQLIIAQEVSSVSGLSGSDITMNKRTINTTVLAEDGKTIILGGLIDEDVQEVEQKVPLLGDIPYIGRLFSSTSNSVKKRNLMVFIKPSIIRTPDDANEVTQLKYTDIRNKEISQNMKGLGLMPDAELPILSPIAAGAEIEQGASE